MFLVSWVLGVGVLLGVVVVARRFAVFLRRVIRLIGLVLDLVMGGCSLVFFSIMGGCSIGQILCASRWYLSIVLTTSFVVLSMCSVVVMWLGSWI